MSFINRNQGFHKLQNDNNNIGKSSNAFYGNSNQKITRLDKVISEIFSNNSELSTVGILQLKKGLSQYENEIHLIQAKLEEDINKDLSFNLLNIQNEIIEIINTLGRCLNGKSNQLEEEVAQSIEKNRQSLTTQLIEIQKYAQHLEDKIEKIQCQLLRNNSEISSKESVSRASFQDLNETINSLRKFEKEIGGLGSSSKTDDFEELLLRYFGVNQRRFDLKDENTLKQIILLTAELKNEVNLDPGVKKTLEALIEEIYTDIAKAFLKRYEILSSIPLRALYGHKGAMAQLCAEHDLYWNFHDPLEFVISYDDFLEMAQYPPDRLSKYVNHINVSKKKYTEEEIKVNIENLINKSHEGISYLENHPINFIDKDFNLIDADTLNSQEKEIFYEHKLNYLRKKMNLNRSKAPLQVVVLGGGPGGLMHALVARLKGARVSLYEKRSQYTRINPVFIDQQTFPLLSYFGFFNRLNIDEIFKDSDLRNFKLKDVEQALKKIIENLLEKSKFSEEIIHSDCELIDVRLGSVKEEFQGRVKAGCLIKQKEKDVTWHSADFIIDATGVSGVVGTKLGQELDVLSNSHIRLPFRNIGGLVPKEEDQEKIVKLKEEITKLQDEIKRCLQKNPKLESLKLRQEELQKNLDDLVEEIINNELRTDEKITQKERQELIKNAKPFAIFTGIREPALLLGDCLVAEIGDSLARAHPAQGLGMNYALQSSIYFSKALEDRNHTERSELVLRNYIYSGRAKSGNLVEQSANNSRTLNYGLHRLKREGFEKSHIVNFKRLAQKMQEKIPFTMSDLKGFISIKQAWASYLGETLPKSWQITINEKIIELEEYRKTLKWPSKS